MNTESNATNRQNRRYRLRLALFASLAAIGAVHSAQFALQNFRSNNALPFSDSAFTGNADIRPINAAYAWLNQD